MEIPHILIIETQDRTGLVEELSSGAQAIITGAGCTLERVAVPTVPDIPAAIVYAMRSMEFFTARRRFDGYVALGCLVRGDNTWYDVASTEVMRSLQDLLRQNAIALGNGIIFAESEEQAWTRAALDQKNFGAKAARACLDMVDLKRVFRLFPR